MGSIASMNYFSGVADALGMAALFCVGSHGF